MYKHVVRAWWLLVMTACGRIGFDASDGGGTSGDTGATIDAALAPLPASPFAYWKFDEGSGTTATDSTGNGHALMLVNGTSRVPGIAGGAVRTDGTNQYVVSMSTLDLSSTTAVTLSVWLRYSYGGPGPHKNVVELTPNFNTFPVGFGLFVDDTGDCTTPQIGVGVIGEAGGSAGCYVPPSSAVWHHLVAVYDKTLPGCCESALYIDGAPQTAMPTFVQDNTNNFGNETLYVLSRGGTMAFAAADLDELAIFSRALTPAEIAAF